jgi:hypothetical protein
MNQRELAKFDMYLKSRGIGYLPDADIQRIIEYTQELEAIAEEYLRRVETNTPVLASIARKFKAALGTSEAA